MVERAAHPEFMSLMAASRSSWNEFISSVAPFTIFIFTSLVQASLASSASVDHEYVRDIESRWRGLHDVGRGFLCDCPFQRSSDQQLFAAVRNLLGLTDIYVTSQQTRKTTSSSGAIVISAKSCIASSSPSCPAGRADWPLRHQDLMHRSPARFSLREFRSRDHCNGEQRLAGAGCKSRRRWLPSRWI